MIFPRILILFLHNYMHICARVCDAIVKLNRNLCSNHEVFVLLEHGFKYDTCGFMEKPAIVPATPGLQGIYLSPTPKRNIINSWNLLQAVGYQIIHSQNNYIMISYLYKKFKLSNESKFSNNI